MTILDEILDHKRAEVERVRAGKEFRDLGRLAESSAEPVRGFRAALVDGEPEVLLGCHVRGGTEDHADLGALAGQRRRL